MEWYLKAIKNYAGFTDRARRKEYWMYTLFNFLFLIAATIIDNILDLTFDDQPYGALYLVYSLAVLIPGLALVVRRLHDVGKSGWFLLIILVPIIGIIWLFILLCSDSDIGPNEYGDDPKAGERHLGFPPQNTTPNF